MHIDIHKRKLGIDVDKQLTSLETIDSTIIDRHIN